MTTKRPSYNQNCLHAAGRRAANRQKGLDATPSLAQFVATKQRTEDISKEDAKYIGWDELRGLMYWDRQFFIQQLTVWTWEVELWGASFRGPLDECEALLLAGAIENDCFAQRQAARDACEAEELAGYIQDTKDDIEIALKIGDTATAERLEKALSQAAADSLK